MDADGAHNVRTPIVCNPVFCTPTQKRLRDQFQTSIHESVTKTPRLSSMETPLKLIQIIDKRFDKQAEAMDIRFQKQIESIQTAIQTLFRDCEASLLHELGKRMNELNQEIVEVKERVSKLETAVGETIAIKNENEKLKDDIKKLKAYVQKQENSIVACDVRITGVPSGKHENLYTFYEKICEAVKISPFAVKTIYRVVHTKSRKNIEVADIIVKFLSPYERNYFLNIITSYIKSTQDVLRLNLIGFESTTPFYINENLTPDNHHIFIRAHHLKRDGKISSAYAYRGLIYIRKLGSDESIHIDDIEKLNQLFPPQITQNSISEFRNIEQEETNIDAA